jgi:ribosomal protein S12 methylthiotransferase accessory factor
LSENIKTCVKLARRRKIEVLILDQTRSDVGLPVVKVVAPGLRQFWARFAPGRLYETPVRMGWLNVPLKEEQLNTAHLIM